MSVHIDELHSEVVPTGTSDAPHEAESVDPWAAEERWQEIRCRAEWLAGRVCAVDFDD
ncbi:hypothetical protein [Streptomyces sp. NPDC005374]|uniref:hypothetical protein n=1 Tax=Streptomyces sp. NPDC005374 TaxID=3364713 RepID=UPI0036BBBDA1